MPYKRFSPSSVNIAMLCMVVLLSISIVGFSLHQTEDFLQNVDTIVYEDQDSIQPPKTPKQEFIEKIETKPITLIFGGDVMLARHVQILQERAGSYTAAWEDIADVFRTADVAVVNLESPFSENPAYPTEGFVFKVKPLGIEGLTFAGIDVVSLANNHAHNAGHVGLEYTFVHLQENNISYVGAGLTATEAGRAVIKEVHGTSIAFIAQGYPIGFAATDTTSGIAEYDIDDLQRSIKAVRDDVDYVVALFHGGIEYTPTANWQQRAFAHAAIDAGADVVIGHHPHWIQETEVYKGKHIFYSLGNLIFDQNWSRRTSEGLVVQMTIDEGEIVYEVLPVVIEKNFKPRFADQAEMVSFKDPALEGLLSFDEVK